LCDPRACPNVHRKWDGTRKHFRLLGGTDQRFSPTIKARIPPDVVNYLLQTGVSEGQKNRRRRRWKPVTPPERNVVCMQLEQRFFHEIPSYQLNKVRTVGDHLQLLMKIHVLLSNGAEKDLSVLVDTGAEANLIKKGFFNDSLMRSAREPLSFFHREWATLGGGKITAKLTLFFEQVVSGQKLPNVRSFQANFYEAEIGVDAILSFPWMAEHKIGVFPHHQALALEEPVFTLLFGVGSGSSRRARGRKNHRQVRRKWVQKNIQQIDISDEDLEKYLLSVQKMRLELPSEGFDEPAELTDEEIDVVVQNLLKAPESLSCNYIEPHECTGVEDPRIGEYRKKIHELYNGTVLCQEVKPDPPVRGMYGYAHIALKEKAVPQRKHPFVQHGDRCRP